MGDTVASYSQNFSVTDEGVKCGQPLDLGTLMLEMIRRLKVGDVAPNFDVKTLSGESLKLNDLRGKYVLLDFWATWCGPCMDEVPHLVAAHERFGSRENFAMVGLSCDTDVAALKNTVADKKMDWTQAVVGRESPVSKDYGVRGIPSIFLIGPDGKIVAKDLRGDAIQSILAEHLK